MELRLTAGISCCCHHSSNHFNTYNGAYVSSQEEKAELKASNYLLLNEKAALELKLSGKESQEKAYLVTIEHLKSEVTDQMPEDSNGKKVCAMELNRPTAHRHNS